MRDSSDYRSLGLGPGTVEGAPALRLAGGRIDACIGELKSRSIAGSYLGCRDRREFQMRCGLS